MELRHLRSFIAVAEESNFTRAASKLLIAQPALSQQIRKLEEHLGVTLFDRTTRRVQLTDAGDALLLRSRRVLREVDAIYEEIAAVRGLQTGKVVVGVTPTLGAFDVGAELATFATAHPGITIAVREGFTSSLLSRLRADELDLAFVTRVSERDLDRISVTALAEDRLAAVVPVAHRTAGRTCIELGDLREERFVGFPAGATIRDAVDGEARRQGFVPDFVCEANDVGRIRAMVAAGLGVSVLPLGDVGDRTDVVAVPLLESHLTHEVLVATREGRELGPAAAALVALVS